MPTTKPKSKESIEKPLIIDNTVIELTIDAKTASHAYDEAVEHMAKNLKTAGFRKGKVPTAVAESMLRQEDIIQHALEHIVPGIYKTAIEKSGKEPLTQPEFKVISANTGEDWKLEASIAEAPEINLKDYKKIAKEARKQAEKELVEQETTAKAEKKDGFKPATQDQKDGAVVQKIYQQLLSELKPQIAELLVKEEIRADFGNLRRQLDQMKIPLEKFLELRKITIDDLTNQLAAEALGRLQLSFLIAALAREAKVTVEQSDLDAAMEKITDPELKKQQTSDPMYRQLLAQTILRRKVAEHLLSL
jgi:FKBP-type peptidyl-prolyl cis-trans isomerase (trigger factor)